MVFVLVLVVNVLSGLLLAGTILMHSGKDAGLSGAFGVGDAAASGRSTVTLERNLTRVTLAAGIVWAVTAVLLARGV